MYLKKYEAPIMELVTSSNKDQFSIGCHSMYYDLFKYY